MIPLFTKIRRILSGMYHPRLHFFPYLGFGDASPLAVVCITHSSRRLCVSFFLFLLGPSFDPYMA